MMTCTLLVNGSSSGELQAAHLQPIFSPKLPLAFGRRENSEDSVEILSFIGCINALSINGDASGFRQGDSVVTISSGEALEGGQVPPNQTRLLRGVKTISTHLELPELNRIITVLT